MGAARTAGERRQRFALSGRAIIRILICEPDPTGHHLRYVESIARQTLKRGHVPVLATTKKALLHPAYRELRASIPESVMRTVRMPDPTIPLLSRYSRWQQIHRQWLSWLCFFKCYRELPRDAAPDVVLIPYFDDLELAVALAGSPFGRTPWVGILLKSRFHHATVNPFTPPAQLSRLRRWFFERNLNSSALRALITIDEMLPEFYQASSVPQPKLHFVGEPADLAFTMPQAEARRRLGVPEDGCYILFYGNVHMRKGLAQVIEALGALPEERGAKLLIVGPQDPAERQYIADKGARLSNSKRLFAFDRFASIDDESVAFSAADIVWVGYSQHYFPSSVQGKCCRAGRAMIACREGNIGWTTLRHQLGAAVDIHDPAAVRDALLSLMDADQTTAERFRAAGKIYAHQRSGDDFGERVTAILEGDR